MIRKNKKAAWARGLVELFGHSRCPADYLGGALDFGAGVAGFGVVPVDGRGAAGLAAPVPVDGGAATPDCALYVSTTGLVMSTASPHHSTGLWGQGLEVSTMTPNPFSWEYFTIMGAIFCRMRLAISCC